MSTENIYVIKLLFDQITVSADMRLAESPILYATETGWVNTGAQVGDVGHSLFEMAMHVVSWLGRDYWLDPSAEITCMDDDSESLYDRKTEREYIANLIVEVV